MKSQHELLLLQKRLRTVRESKALTLSQVASLSHGRISAIALGSYERGDRSISAQKVLELAEIYQLPAAELFSQPEQLLEQGRVVIDFRKLNNDSDPSGLRLREIVTAIASVRRDWNGEVISLRDSDVRSLQIFASLSGVQIRMLLARYALTQSK